MTNLLNIDSLPNGSPYLYQFDCDELDIPKLNSWLLDMFTAYHAATAINQNSPMANLFADGNRFEADIMLWLEPGWFLIVPLQWTFQYKQVSRKNGKDIAPYHINCTTTFEYPAPFPITFRAELSFDNTPQASQAFRMSAHSVILLAMDVFLSEVITE